EGAAKMAGVVGADQQAEDEGEKRPLEHEVADLLPGTSHPVVIDDGEADQAEERAGGADYGNRRVPQIAEARGGEGGEGVKKEKTGLAELGLKKRPDLVEDHHVEADMDEAAVGEG